MVTVQQCLVELLCVLLTSAVLCHAQTDRLFLLPTSIESWNDVLVQVDGQEVYALSQTPEEVTGDTDSVLYARYDLFNLTTRDSTVVVVPADQIRHYRFTSMSIHADTLVIIDLSGMLRFVRRSGVWQYDRYHQYDHTFFSSRSIGDSILLWNQVNASYGHRSTVFYTARSDRRSGDVSAIIDYPQDSTFLLTYVQPRTALSWNGTTAALSGILTYRVDVYAAGGKVTSLLRDPPFWESYDGQIPRLEPSQRAQSIFPALTNVVRNSSTITAVHVLTNDDLLVYWNAFETSNHDTTAWYSVDLWRSQHGEWQLKSNDHRVYPPDTNAVFSLTGDWLHPRHRCDGKFVMDVLQYPGEMITRTEWTSYGEYLKELNSYALQNKPRLCLRVRDAATVCP